MTKLTRDTVFTLIIITCCSVLVVFGLKTNDFLFYFYNITVYKIIDSLFILDLLISSTILRQFYNEIFNGENFKMIHYFTHDIFQQCQLINDCFNHNFLIVFASVITCIVTMCWLSFSLKMDILSSEQMQECVFGLLVITLE